MIRLGLADLYDRAQQTGSAQYMMVRFANIFPENITEEQRDEIVSLSKTTFKNFYYALIKQQKETGSKILIDDVCGEDDLSLLIDENSYTFSFHIRSISSDSILSLFRECARDCNNSNSYMYSGCMYDTLDENMRGEKFYLEDCKRYLAEFKTSRNIISIEKIDEMFSM